MSETQIAQQRTFKVGTQQMANKFELTTTATTLGGFISDLENYAYDNDISINTNAKYVGMPGRISFIDEESVIPESVARIYMYPKKTEAGVDRNELYRMIKQQKETYGKEAVKTHYGNYTQIPNDELAQLVNSFGNDMSPTNPEVSQLQDTIRQLKAEIESLRNQLEGREDEDSWEVDEYFEIKNALK